MCDTLGSAVEWAERIHAEACAEACAGLDPAAIPALVEAAEIVAEHRYNDRMSKWDAAAALRSALAKVKEVAK